MAIGKKNLNGLQTNGFAARVHTILLVYLCDTIMSSASMGFSLARDALLSTNKKKVIHFYCALCDLFFAEAVCFIESAARPKFYHLFASCKQNKKNSHFATRKKKQFFSLKELV